jgi:hypothetical protein
MKKIYFLLIALCVFTGVNAQNPIIDNSFNLLDNGAFSQNIGYNATLLNDNTILSVYNIDNLTKKNY